MLYGLMAKNSPEFETSKIGRPRKNETIRERQINIYLKNLVQKEEWKKQAAEDEMSLSSWIQYRVEDSLSQNGDGPRYSRRLLIDRNEQLEKSNRALEQDLEVMTKAYQALDRELKTFRLKPFMDPVYQGYRELHRKLVATFRENQRISYDDLFSVLGLDPTDIESAKAVSSQIDVLLDYGVIEQDLRCWRWIR